MKMQENTKEDMPKKHSIISALSIIFGLTSLVNIYTKRRS